MTAAVRNCMEFRYRKFDFSKVSNTSTAKGPIKDPLEAILELTYLMNPNEDGQEEEDISDLIESFIKNPESVLQELDIQRLRAIIYRDVVRQDRSKAGKTVVVVVVI
jgi:predicted nucleic-acid-binding protein